jgi:ubiquinone/menaquinone biosynthesis C-methylase UbiE
MSDRQVSFETPLQHVRLQEMTDNGLVLDIGGGGEGFISRIAGERVCAVDISISKIIEARIHGSHSTWIVNDGKQLCFKSSSFPIASVCFALGFIPEWNTKRVVLMEINRILEETGALILYFMIINEDSDSFLFRGEFTLPDDSQSVMSYRVKGNQKQSEDAVLSLLGESGFEPIDIDSHSYWSRVVARKVDSPKP